MYKINAEKWQEIAYYINNFFLPVQYTNGRGIYPDRLTLVRSKNLDTMFYEDKDMEFAIVNARALDSTHKVQLSREILEKYLRNPILINEIINVGNDVQNDYTGLFEKVANSLKRAKTTDFDKLNRFVIAAYKLLEPKDALKIAGFREYAFNICIKEELMDEDFCKEQIALLPNSLVALSGLKS